MRLGRARVCVSVSVRVCVLRAPCVGAHVRCVWACVRFCVRTRARAHVRACLWAGVCSSRVHARVPTRMHMRASPHRTPNTACQPSTLRTRSFNADMRGGPRSRWMIQESTLRARGGRGVDVSVRTPSPSASLSLPGTHRHAQLAATPPTHQTAQFSFLSTTLASTAGQHGPRECACNPPGRCARETSCGKHAMHCRTAMAWHFS